MRIGRLLLCAQEITTDVKTYFIKVGDRTFFICYANYHSVHFVNFFTFTFAIIFLSL